jgi:hypothetical protein
MIIRNPEGKSPTHTIDSSRRRSAMATSRNGSASLADFAPATGRAVQPEVRRLIGRLADARGDDLKAVIQELMAIGRPAIEPLGRSAARARALAVSHRRALVAALGMLYRHDPRAVIGHLLLRARRDPDRGIRRLAGCVLAHVYGFLYCDEVNREAAERGEPGVEDQDAILLQCRVGLATWLASVDGHEL